MESARVLNVDHAGVRRDLLTALLIGALGAAGLVVMTLLARRAAGGLVQPLGGFSLVAVTALGLLLATGWRWGWSVRGIKESTLSLLALAIPGIAAFLLLCVLSLPGTANWALMLSWLAFFTGEAVWWWQAYLSLQTPARRSVPPSVATVAVSEVDNVEAPLPYEVFQQITRTRAGDEERIAVSLRVSFAAGQRVAVEHVAFCPPLRGMPRLAAELLDGLDATVSLTSVQPFGFRLEVRLNESPDEATEVLVEVSGGVPGVSGGAHGGDVGA